MPVSVPFVSVRYGDGLVEELAYRDGAFRYPYLESSRVGDTFSLRRSGGWPSAPTVVVEEAAPAPQPAWSVLYHRDFRTLSPATITAYGAVTIDGLTWYRKPGGQAGDASISASGLSVSQNGAGEGHSTLFGPRLVLPMSSVPGYNPNAPVAFYAKTSSPSAANSGQCVVGTSSFALNASAPTYREMELRQGLYLETGNSGNILRQFTVNNFSLPYTGGTLTTNVGLVIRPIDRRQVSYGAFSWTVNGASALPDPVTGALDPTENSNTAQQLVLQRSTDGQNVQLYRDMSAVQFFVAKNAGAGGPDSHLLELAILQPRVAA